MTKKITIFRNNQEPITTQEQVDWAVNHFINSLESNGFVVDHCLTQKEKRANDAKLFIRIDGPKNTKSLLGENLETPESFLIKLIESNDGYQQLWVTGADVRGLVYALLELSDIFKFSTDPLDYLLNIGIIKESPINQVRSIKRTFVNEIDDKKWFYSKSFWQEYLTELASQRFNRFSLAFGMGYDLGHDPDIIDFYLCFAYPFLVSVPEYSVKVAGLSDSEREKNLEILRFIGKEAKIRGLDFYVGLWTHAFEPQDSPNVRYKIKGIDREIHAQYCQDALKTLLIECPEIDGLTIRVHYESGIPEPAHLFWKVVLKGAALCGREIKLDLHSKGIDDDMIKVAEENDVPFSISPKFWAEHMGLPYHQTEIRETELPLQPNPEAGNMVITTTSRRFTRYGYADFLKVNRKYDVFYRIWPGTQRVLLWGDPEIAAGYGRTGTFGEAKGIEVMEPLSFKSRKTSETPTERDPYLDESLRLEQNEWKKYLYTYRLWGRLLYNPDANPETWQRYLRSQFGMSADSLEKSLKFASKILPLITVAHSPSVANNIYWPEIYSNIFIVDVDDKPEYHTDGRTPPIFNEVSPLDPGLFYRINEFVDDVLQNTKSGKISPINVAEQLEYLSLQAKKYLYEAKSKIDDQNDITFRRWIIDIEAQIGIGLFFSYKFRAGTAYAFFERIGDARLLQIALKYYKYAKNSWEQLVIGTSDVYTDDITFGYKPYMRGHWADRMEEIEEDLQNMENKSSVVKKDVSDTEIEKIMKWLYSKPFEYKFDFKHIPPKYFKSGKEIQISIELPSTTTFNVLLKYRYANQAEQYKSIKMNYNGERFMANIPASYTSGQYPIIYLFEIENESNEKMLYPGFDRNLSNQPYYVVSKV
ncbi:hypothetical protein [Pseudogracilibacillus auburnensis]|uniref:hypothetical protein n=1 Tax=Pseudogracilibacillus auburnensis TaxID=1494959 RepID=UPI001A96E6DB|nr:hypothetical protein [Pseudogracilibacillus auburnensis]MBO1005077.1 hypothetical protein [Pseudogracilibacillus auburnensis]